MNYMRGTLCFFATVLFICSCADDSTDRAQQVVDDAIDMHGGAHFENALISFDFRDRHYMSKRENGQYTYIRTFQDSSKAITDVLINSSDFQRLVDGDSVDVVDSMAIKYKNSVNSVLYFVQLPYLLNDPAVIKSYEGHQTIKDQPYDVIKVTFQQSGGGKDFDDEYRYWFHTQHHTMDYMAYTYSVDGGGARFREAFHRREIEGIIFQDYINYEVPVRLSLHDVPKVFEQGDLTELSRIENSNIQVKRLD